MNYKKNVPNPAAQARAGARFVVRQRRSAEKPTFDVIALRQRVSGFSVQATYTHADSAVALAKAEAKARELDAGGEG